MLNFITKEQKTDVLSQEGGIMLGYIENNVFFPNNSMMFKVEWMLEIVRYMQKLQGEIPLPYGITAHYKIKDMNL